MPLPTALNKAIATTLITAGTAGGVYAACIAQRIISVDSSRITRKRNTTAEFHESAAIRQLANPRQHQSVSDTRSATIDIPSRHQDISDQELLARSIKAFYGGLVLGPERAVLRAVGARFARFTESPLSNFVWSPGRLSSTILPPVGTSILGAFQVVDVSLSDKSDEDSSIKQVTRSHIDLCFGVEGSSFAGAQRFSVTRESGASGEQDRVQIHFESMACNPSVDSLGILRFFTWFHDLYAELLFRETVYSVQRVLQKESRTVRWWI